MKAPLNRPTRNGNLKILCPFLSALQESGVVLNPCAYFSSATRTSCYTNPSKYEFICWDWYYSLLEISQLNAITFEKFADPIIAAQNFCNAIVRMRDGTFITLKNTEAESVHRTLYDRIFEKFFKLYR